MMFNTNITGFLSNQGQGRFASRTFGATLDRTVIPRKMRLFQVEMIFRPEDKDEETDTTEKLT